MKFPFPVGKVDFIQGDEAIARAAILAGCRFYAGYPITPASEIFEAMALYMPLIDGVVIQMEDEIASIAAVIGASWAGAKAMTATSGPGFSLMQENIGYAVMTETPIVVVDVQRGGPSTGQPTLPSQGDIMQAIWGTHGDHSLIVLSPSTVQEAFDFTIRAFNLAEKYRTPVILLTDAEVGHMRERIYIPNPEEIEIVNRKLPQNEEEVKLPFGDPHGDLVPPMPIFGKGFKTYVTGLTHDERGRPRTVEREVHERLIRRIVEKIERNKKDIFDYQAYELEDAEIAVVATGIVARSALRAVRMLRDEGIKAGLVKINTIWPFDFDLMERIAEKVEAMYVPEMNLGQLYHLVKEGANGKAPVKLISKIGGEAHTPMEITEFIRRDMK
ncbi:2-oxoacid:acceptor oxidoreductase subunit alpha [Pyrococcus kukulkanii]|uniref:2-oxoacid:acceptor oxidoreductase subunit alpha n=1 Tax=Pyrococcus kukulkanii TaxID=1609559 RepID=UPI00356ABDCB